MKRGIRSNMKSRLNLLWKIFNVLAGIAFLYFALRGVTWDEVYTNLILSGAILVGCSHSQLICELSP